MTNIGTAPCLDQVHVYIDTGCFTTTLLTAAMKSGTAIILSELNQTDYQLGITWTSASR